MKTTKFWKLNGLIALAGIALIASPAQGASSKGNNANRAAGVAAANRNAVPVNVAAPGTRSAAAARFSGRNVAPFPARSISAPRLATANLRAQQFNRQRAFQNAAASRAGLVAARNFNADRARFSSRDSAAWRNRDSDHHWDRDHDSDHHHSREWWRRYHRHDRVVLIDGALIYNPFYYDAYYPYGPDYYYSEPAPVYYDAPAADDEPVSVAVQRELRREGYYRGPIDGVIGPGTRRAIASFQRDNGLTPTGRINDRLLDAMGLM